MSSLFKNLSNGTLFVAKPSDIATFSNVCMKINEFHMRGDTYNAIMVGQHRKSNKMICVPPDVEVVPLEQQIPSRIFYATDAAKMKQGALETHSARTGLMGEEAAKRMVATFLMKCGAANRKALKRPEFDQIDIEEGIASILRTKHGREFSRRLCAFLEALAQSTEIENSGEPAREADGTGLRADGFLGWLYRRKVRPFANCPQDLGMPPQPDEDMSLWEEEITGFLAYFFRTANNGSVMKK